MLMLMLPLLAFDASAINFLSHELYRGTARGLEISVIHRASVVLLLTFTILRGWRNPVPDGGSRLYLIYFLASLPSLLHADSLLYSAFELWKMAMGYLVFLAVYRYLEYSRGDFDIVLSGAAAVVLIGFLVIVRQHVGGIHQARGVFPHQNSLAMFMMLTGTIFLARFFNRSEGGKTLFFLLVFGVASASLLRTYSRGAIICYPLGCGLTLLCSMRGGVSLYKRYKLALLALCGMAGFLIFLPKLAERFENAPQSSGETRRNFAVAAFNMIRDAPLIGVGLNNWGIRINPPYSYSRHRDPLKGYSEDYKDGIVETIYLLVAAECGLPCLAALLAWLGFYWISAWRLLKTFRDSQYFYLASGILGGLTGALLQSSLEWILKQQINFLWLMIVFALISFCNTHGRQLLAMEQIRHGIGRRS